MKEHLSDMLLNPEIISTEHRLTKGLGFAYWESARKAESQQIIFDHFAFAATNLRRAAADALLLDDFEAASELFVRAGEAYSHLRMPYGLMMFELAGDLKRADNLWRNIIGQEQSVIEQHVSSQVNRQHVYTIMFYAAKWGAGKESREGLPKGIWNELEAARPLPVGVLGLPVGTYLNLSVALMGDEKVSIEEGLMPFLNAYNSAIVQASSNAHHWRQMATPFHPAEPDILAILVLVHEGLKYRQRSILDVLKAMPLAWQTLTVIKEFLWLRFRDDLKRET